MDPSTPQSSRSRKRHQSTPSDPFLVPPGSAAKTLKLHHGSAPPQSQELPDRLAELDEKVDVALSRMLGSSSNPRPHLKPSDLAHLLQLIIAKQPDLIKMDPGESFDFLVSNTEFASKLNNAWVSAEGYKSIRQDRTCCTLVSHSL